MANSVEQEINQLNAFLKKQRKDTMNELHTIVVDKTPVDTGFLKQSVNVFGVKENGLKYSIGATQNTNGYSNSIMILGRRMQDGKMQGSNQLPDGILPTVRQFFAEKNAKVTIKTGG